MRSRQRVRPAFVAAVAGALVAIVVSGCCTSARPDRAGGGTARGPTLVAQFATEGDAPRATAKLWAGKVQDLSRSDIEIHDLTGQHKGGASYEGGVDTLGSARQAVLTKAIPRGGALTFDQFAFPSRSDCGGYAVSVGGKTPWVRP